MNHHVSVRPSETKRIDTRLETFPFSRFQDHLIRADPAIVRFDGIFQIDVWGDHTFLHRHQDFE